MFIPTWLRRSAGIVALTALLATSACSSGADPTSDDTNAVTGDITVLTWRTDLLEDGTLDEYAERFKAEYPDVNVEFEGITDYEGEVRTRMNTKDYGDVLAIPNSVTVDQLSNFFEPLGDVEEMEKTYRWLRDRAYDGKAYGIPVVGNVQGVLINQRVWQEAGVTETPTSPQEFIDAMKKIKAAKPDVVPVYTNYSDGWPLTAWEYYRGGVSADPDFITTLGHDDSPWDKGKDHAIIDGLLYDLVAAGLTEADPTTTNWELSKTMMGEGDIATMFLGSWAIPQIQKAAVDGGKAAEDIAYIPFPSSLDGKMHAIAAGDYNLAINVNSEHKAAARAWIDWFIHDSGYSVSQVGLNPLIDGENPQSLEDFVATGAELVTLNPAQAGEETLVSDIQTASEINLDGPELRQKIVDLARSGDQTKEQIFAGLNERWAAGRAQVGS